MIRAFLLNNNAMIWIKIFFSGDKIFTLYEELQTSDVPQHVMDHFQEMVSALVTDVKKIEQKNKLMEERYQKYVSNL